MFDHDFAAVRRDVEVSDGEIRAEVRQLPPGAGCQVNEPQILVAHLAAQNRQRPSGCGRSVTDHPGHSLITVTEGAVTAYEGHDATCTPTVYTLGMTFVDERGEHVHVIRNEGAVQARTITVQLLPAGAPRRIDAPANPACTF